MFQTRTGSTGHLASESPATNFEYCEASHPRTLPKRLLPPTPTIDAAVISRFYNRTGSPRTFDRMKPNRPSPTLSVFQTRTRPTALLPISTHTKAVESTEVSNPNGLHRPF